MSAPGIDGWDQALRDAHECGEAIVIRGDMIWKDFALDVVELQPDANDPFADAAARAFEGT